jgi:excisionase family DNA binding protein
MTAVTITQITPPELQSIIEASLIKILSQGKTFIAPESGDLITRQEAAGLLHITLPTLLTYTLSGRVNGYRIGRRVLYKKSEILDAVTLISTTKKVRA